jgi:hypothetical protein
VFYKKHTFQKNVNRIIGHGMIMCVEFLQFEGIINLQFTGFLSSVGLCHAQEICG